MARRSHDLTSLAGSLLLAHPGLLDPNFRKSVILLSGHTQEGAMGVVLNRPTGKILSELNPDMAGETLGRVPVYVGGPVQTDQLLLVAWQPEPEKAMLKLFFGIEPKGAAELLESNPSTILRAFLGYSGWGKQQLEGELSANTWVVCPVHADLLLTLNGPVLWQQLLLEHNPLLGLMGLAPDDPSVN